MRKIGILGLCAFALALGGCGGGQKQLEEMEANNTAFVFGYVDMEEAPTSLEHFQVRQVKPKVKKPYWSYRTHEGIFYMENVPVGSHQFSRIGGPGGFFSSANYYYFNFPRQTGGFKVDKPGVYFLGAFKFVKSGSIFNRKYDIQKTDKPLSGELLAKIMPFAKGTKWEAEIRSTLAGLAK